MRAQHRRAQRQQRSCSGRRPPKAWKSQTVEMLRQAAGPGAGEAICRVRAWILATTASLVPVGPPDLCVLQQRTGRGPAASPGPWRCSVNLTRGREQSALTTEHHARPGLRQRTRRTAGIQRFALWQVGKQRPSEVT